MSNEEVPKEVLVVISKVKAYIRAKSSMNTSDAVTEALSELVRSTCDQAIEKAKSGAFVSTRRPPHAEPSQS